MKHRIDQYEKEKRQEILQLNNDNAKYMKRLEDIKMEQLELNADSEKVKQKKLKEMSELASILMAIENIEQKCFNRKYRSYDGKSNRGAILKHAIVPNNKPKNYNATSATKCRKQLDSHPCSPDSSTTDSDWLPSTMPTTTSE